MARFSLFGASSCMLKPVRTLAGIDFVVAREFKSHFADFKTRQGASHKVGGGGEIRTLAGDCSPLTI